MDHAFAAGEESEASGDEWDIGTSYEKTHFVQVRSEILHLAKGRANLASSVTVRLLDLPLIEYILLKTLFFVTRGNICCCCCCF